MSIKYIKGNIFNAKTQTIVNTVNCVGVMGTGIALIFKLRYPRMFDIYKAHCRNKNLEIGKLWLFRGEPNAPWVLNFPTKFHWKYPSKIEYIEMGLQKFLDSYKVQGIESIAFPLLGSQNGGLDSDEVYQLMSSYLSKCEIPVEIYEYDPSAQDDLFELFALKWNTLNVAQIQKITGIRKDRIQKISNIIESKSIKSMIDLINESNIGLGALEKCFSFILKV